MVVSSVFGEDGLLKVCRVEDGEALEDVFDLLLGQAVQNILIIVCVELGDAALLTHSSLVADIQVDELDVDVQL